MTRVQEITIQLTRCLYSFVKKENEMLHYQYYVQNLVLIEKYITENELIEKAFEGTPTTLEKYNYNKQKLNEYNKSLKLVSKEISYRTYYQNFEEFLHKILVTIYTYYPEFLKKDSDIITTNYDILFNAKNIQDLQGELIEKKAKELVQSNNIISLIKKFKQIFGIDLKLSNEELNLLFVTAQNRNILTHNNGVINSIYLNELRKNKIESKYAYGDIFLDKISEELTIVENNISNIGEKIHKQIESKISQLENYSKNIS